MDAARKNRMTAQRRIILEELRNMRTHPTADDVYRAVRKRLPHISLGTVYRNLDVLSEAGEILRLEKCGTQFRFDGDTHTHYHIRCTRCGRLDDVEGVDVEVTLASDGPSHDYQIIGHVVELLGVCPRCKAGVPDKHM